MMWTSNDIGKIEAGLRARGIRDSLATADTLADGDTDGVGESLLIFGGAMFTLSLSPGAFNKSKVDEYEAWGSDHDGAGNIGKTFFNLERALDRLAALMKGECCD